MSEPDFNARIEALDTSLFAPLPSQTTQDDRRALLAVQRSLRRRGPFTYLEVGSHLGGSLQTFLRDPQCRRLISIDPRPGAQPDERFAGRAYVYAGNSTARMQALLARLAPEAMPKLTCHETDFEGYCAAQAPPSADLVLLDGEHTPAAMARDLALALALQPAPRIILLHDVDALRERLAEVEAQAAAAGLVACLLSAQLLCLAPAEFIREWAELPVRPVRERPGRPITVRASRPPVQTRRWVVATTLVAGGETLVARLVATGQFADAGVLDPRSPTAPSAWAGAPEGATNPWPLALEYYTPGPEAFDPAAADETGVLFLVPAPGTVLNALGTQPGLPFAGSWEGIRRHLCGRYYAFAERARQRWPRGRCHALFGPPEAADAAALARGLETTPRGLWGDESVLAGEIAPPPLEAA
ncbi:MAG: class I SAM-dependent methyltransferase, partial [Opitutales bacterium]